MTDQTDQTDQTHPTDLRPASHAEQAIRMNPEQERAAMADAGSGVEPADEGVGILTDEDGDDHTRN